VLQATHRESPPWPVDLTYEATVSARASRSGFRTVNFSDRSPSPPLAKGMDHLFTNATNVPAPYEVHWQVVNTGQEAARAQQLRGGFYGDSSRHYETTSYRGRHAIQGYVVKDGRCVAQSRPVFVLIR
jgi:hypothetical protein